MPRGNTCTICRNDQRKAIDLALGNGKPTRELALKFSVSAAALDRHKLRHLQPAVARAAARREDLTAEALVAKLVGYLEEAEHGIAIAKSTKDLPGLARCIKEARETAVYIGKTIGLWSDKPQIVNDNRRQIAVTLDAKSFEELLAMRNGLEELGVVPALAPGGDSNAA